MMFKIRLGFAQIGLALAIFAIPSQCLARGVSPVIAFDSAACRNDASGKFYVALMRTVFALPNAKLSALGSIPNAIGNGEWPRWTWARPIPPDPLQPSGCPDNPKQAFDLGVSDAVIRHLLDIPAQVAGERPENFSVGLEASDPAQSATGLSESPKQSRLCYSTPGYIWDGCRMRGYLMPGVFMIYKISAPSITGLLSFADAKAFDGRLRAALFRCQVHNYPWQINTTMIRGPAIP